MHLRLSIWMILATLAGCAHAPSDRAPAGAHKSAVYSGAERKAVFFGRLLPNYHAELDQRVTGYAREPYRVVSERQQAMVEDASFDVVALEDARGASHFGGRFEAVRAGNASANIQAQVLERQSELVPPGRTREVSDNGDIDIEQAHFGNLGLVRDVESGKILAIHDDFRQGFSQGELARWLAAHPGPKEVVVVGSVQGRGDTFVRNLVQSTQARRSRLVFVGPQPMDSPGISVHYGAFGDELRIVNPLFPDMAQGSGIAVLPGFKGLKN